MVVIIWHVRAVAVRPPGATIMPVEMLSYVELGERLKISPEAARALVKRHRLPRSRSNTGKTLVHVDLTEISQNFGDHNTNLVKLADITSDGGG